MDLWWQTPGIVPLPSPVRFEPPPGSLRAEHGRALREEWLKQEQEHAARRAENQPEEEQ